MDRALFCVGRITDAARHVIGITAGTLRVTSSLTRIKKVAKVVTQLDLENVTAVGDVARKDEAEV